MLILREMRTKTRFIVSVLEDEIDENVFKNYIYNNVNFFNQRMQGLSLIIADNFVVQATQFPLQLMTF